MCQTFSERAESRAQRAEAALDGQDARTGGRATLGRTYDVSPHGQGFLMIKGSGADATAAPPRIIVVQHWDGELKRVVPTR